MNCKPRLRFAAAALVALGATGSACGSIDSQDVGPPSGNSTYKITQSSIGKLDLLLAVDNSRSMADKQQILNVAVPDLVNRLVNPLCLDAVTNVPLSPASQPASPTDSCPGGSLREFQPVLDIHIGLVDSSLGGHGGDACPDQIPNDYADCANGGTNNSNNDHGHLLTRKDACLPNQVPTYQSLGFLAWDATGMNDTPPGETSLTNLNTRITDLVTGEGQIGCGYTSQEEGWYRFLADPNPYQTIAVVNGQAVTSGRDDALLKERADFLRPSSLLAIIVLTDSNDGSAREGGQYYIVDQLSDSKGAYHLPPARAVCKTNPNDPCCMSCGQPKGSCPADPTCATPLDNLSDPPNLRMFDDKRRFGVDFLYPWMRYVNALTQPTINPDNPDLSLGGASGVPNPIFSDLQPNDSDSTVRTADLVFLAGIVGVPWKDIARDPKDLTQGYMNARELATMDSGHTRWDVILGDPDNYVLPLDPFMIEQIDPRMTGAKNPITGDIIEPPSMPSGANAINGHDRTISARDDLQYACIFPLQLPRDCSKDDSACDCGGGDPDNATNPICSPNPNDTMKPTLQTSAKAYPGLRHLQILKGLGDQGIVASICPAQTSDPSKADFGYRQVVGGIVDRLKTELGGQCLSRTLTQDSSGQVACVVIEATKGPNCNCNAPARQPVPASQEQAVVAAKADPDFATAQWNCFCEIEQASGVAMKTCQNDPSPAPVVPGSNKSVDGWCYIDDTTAPPIGNPELVAKCPATEKRILRFVGAGKSAPNSTLFITCADSG